MSVVEGEHRWTRARTRAMRPLLICMGSEGHGRKKNVVGLTDWIGSTGASPHFISASYIWLGSLPAPRIPLQERQPALERLVFRGKAGKWLVRREYRKWLSDSHVMDGP